MILDDLRYANDPAKGVCVDILGMIAGQNRMWRTTRINTPQIIKTRCLNGHTGASTTRRIYTSTR